jgi:hypothetical protein
MESCQPIKRLKEKKKQKKKKKKKKVGAWSLAIISASHSVLERSDNGKYAV